MDSEPPARQMSASPAAIERAALAIASRPEPHSRLTVAPGTVDRQPGEQDGHPADVAVVLAGLVGRAPVHVVDGGRVQPGVRG